MELLRQDFDTNTNETIEIKLKELKAMIKEAKKKGLKAESEELAIEYAVKKPGLYRLQKVVDEFNLEVHRHTYDALVVTCPKATIKPSSLDRCVGDLSNLTVEVRGTLPMKMVYSRSINKQDGSIHAQSVQNEDLVSPRGLSSSNSQPSRVREGVSWGLRSVGVRINESMTRSGKWLYSIEEVHDGVGNVANFSTHGEDGEHTRWKGKQLDLSLTVHDLPLASLDGCDTRNPLKVPIGESSELPIVFGSPGRTCDDVTHTVTWRFSPINKLTASGDHGEEEIVEEFISKHPRDKPRIYRPGLYTLKSVRNQFCSGEVKGPASCLLINPPKPGLSISSEDIYDKCAGNSIGLAVDLDLVGTPPFDVQYEIIHNRQRKEKKWVHIKGSRHQLELKPRDAGHFTYRFVSIDDEVYANSLLEGPDYTLEQSVKPPASAFLMKPPDTIIGCIGQPILVKALFQGYPPFMLEYELVHEGKRMKHKITGIEEDKFTISTEPLLHGGEYALALVSVQDRAGCKIFLNDEIKITVNRQRPKVSFGLRDGKHKVLSLEGMRVDLPLRLDGEAPWDIAYQNINDPAAQVFQARIQKVDGFLQVESRGIYQLLDVADRHCPGIVDTSAATFEVDWIPRPEIKISDNAGLILKGDKYLRRDVCEGDADAVDIKLTGSFPAYCMVYILLTRSTGSPPYHLKYQQRYKPHAGSSSVSNKDFEAAIGVASIIMDTTRPGLYTYEFSRLSDNAYDHDPRSAALIVEQKVNPKPSASFLKPGQSYKYCKEEEAENEIIPVSLQGLPPFYLEIDIKHQSSSRPETVKIANIEFNQYNFRIPRNVLSLGTHYVSVRKVRDAQGCQQKTEYESPHVQVVVFDVPTIYPLETRTDYCVGDRISYTLSGIPPFEIYYTFEGIQKKAKSPNTNFRRIAERPGEFTITAVSDRVSDCKAVIKITKVIHEMPSVKISKGRQVEVDIHEGGEAEILFEFWGTPPFEFTYTRSTNAKKGQKSRVLETKHDVSYEHSKAIQASQEGTYEVVAVKDRWCSVSTWHGEAKQGQKLLHL
jgi:nucleoporin POM152